MIDMTKERLTSLSKAIPYFPEVDGRQWHISKIRRAAFAGFKVGKQRVLLETCRAGGTVCTSREAIARFLAALNSPASDSTPDLTLAADAAHRELAEVLK
jgi:hypothetical protein